MQLKAYYYANPSSICLSKFYNSGNATSKENFNLNKNEILLSQPKHLQIVNACKKYYLFC